MTYKSWPLGNWHKQWKRPEVEIIKKTYTVDDDCEILSLFEEKLSGFTGAPYVVLIDNCSDALYLCLRYKFGSLVEEIGAGCVTIPARTYVSVPMMVLMAKYLVRFVDDSWQGVYQLKPFMLFDAAMRFCKDMYIPGSEMCISFQYKKRLPIGKGGAILTDDLEAASLYRRLVYEGRSRGVPYEEDNIEFYGWNMYMTPEDAARGILILDDLMRMGGPFDDVGGSDNYPDLRDFAIFKDMAQ